MKAETIGGAIIAAVILLFSNLMTLFQQDPALVFSGITEAAWVSVAGGAAIAFLKDYQALSTRRGLAKLRGKGESK